MKPKNILFKTKNLTEIALLDFGVSKTFNLNKSHKSTMIQGLSLKYSPPEILIDDKSQVSTKSDIFSFGMFIFIYYLYLFKCFI